MAALKSATPEGGWPETLLYMLRGMSEAEAEAIRRAAAPQLHAPPAPPAPALAPALAPGATTRRAAQRQQPPQQDPPAWAVQRWPLSGEAPSVAEVFAAAQLLCNQSSPGEEGIHPWLLKQDSVVVWMHRVISAVWSSGVVPAAWREALLVAICKGCQLLSDNYRGITLISASSKVFVHLLHQRLRPHLLAGLHESQCGFRPSRGTADQLFSMRRVMELARAHQVQAHAAFVDLRKAFDSVPREALWVLLRARGVPAELVALVRELYRDNSVRVAVGPLRSASFSTTSGVRQGCPLSPLLFNVWMDFLCRQVLDACAASGVGGFRMAYRMDGALVAPAQCDASLQLLLLLYADDMVLLAPDQQSLRTALLHLERVAAVWGMAVNHDKTKVLVCAPDEGAKAAAATAEAAAQALAASGRQAGQADRVAMAGGHAACHLQHGTLGLVSSFPYLGGLLEGDGSQDREISRRLGLAAGAFKQLWPRVFKSQRVRLYTRVLVYRAIVLSILLYGAAESWAPTADQLHRLSVFHTTCLRRLLGVSRADRVPNQVLFWRAGIPSMEELLRARRLKWLGHVARLGAERVVKPLLFARDVPGGSRPVGRPHLVWSDMARADLEARAGQLRGRDWYTVAMDKRAWASVVAGPDPGVGMD